MIDGLTMLTERARAWLDWGRKQTRACRLCPRRCGVDRSAGERGWCGAGATARWWVDFVHWGEEAELAPSNTVYLDGCNLACRFCHTDAERRRATHQILGPAAWRGILRRGCREKARNVNLLGGEPTTNLPALIECWAAADGAEADIDAAEGPLPAASWPPLVWNTNAYAEPEAWAVALELADIVLADMKFGNADCAGALAGAADADAVVRRNLLAWRDGAGRRADGSRPRMMVRHLAVPGHFDCCTRPVLAWLAEALPEALVHVKTDYLPMPATRDDPVLGRFPRGEELRAVGEYAAALGLSLDRGGAAPLPGAGPDAKPDGKEDEPNKTQRVLATEIVIRPDGTLYLRHPIKELLALDLLASAPTPPDESEKRP